MSKINPANGLYKKCEELGLKGPCAIVAFSAISGYSIGRSYSILAEHAGRTQTGWTKGISAWDGIVSAFEKFDFSVEEYTPKFGKTVRTLERELKSSHGRFLIMVSGGRHCLSIINGEVVDWTEGRLHRIKKVWRIS